MAERLASKTTRYLVELEVPEAGWIDVDLLIRKARETTGSSEGDARFVRAIFVPEDSSFFLLYEAETAAAATAATTKIDLDIERVSEVLRVTEDEG